MVEANSTSAKWEDFQCGIGRKLRAGKPKVMNTTEMASMSSNVFLNKRERELVCITQRSSPRLKKGMEARVCWLPY